jgi:predicted membrane protein
MSQVKLAETKRRRGLWPVMGLLMAIALGVISYFLAPSVIALTRQLLPQFSTRGMPQQQVLLIFTFLTFVILLAFTAFLVAIFMPKKAINVNENDLRKEREKIQAYKKYEKVRQRKINRETQRYLKEKNEKGK